MSWIRNTRLGRSITTFLTYFLIYGTSSVLIEYLYEFSFMEDIWIQNPLRYLGKYAFAIWIFLFCMKESTLINGEKATYKNCYPPRHTAQWLVHGFGIARGLMEVANQINGTT